MKKKKGAYLVIEIVFAICVLAVLAAAGVVDFKTYSDESKVNTAQNEVMQLGNAVAHYKYDTGTYPQSLNDLAKNGSEITVGGMTMTGYGPWIPEVKNDPWGNPYILQTNENGGYVVYSDENKKKTNSGPKAVDQGVIGFHGL